MFIIAIALCINFIGDGLRDAFDPRQRRMPSDRLLRRAKLGELDPALVDVPEAAPKRDDS